MNPTTPPPADQTPFVPALPRYGLDLHQRVDDPTTWPCLSFRPAKTTQVRALHAKYAQLERDAEDLARRLSSGEESEANHYHDMPFERVDHRFFLPPTLFGQILSSLTLAQHTLERADYRAAVGQLRVTEVLLRLAFTFDYTDQEVEALVEANPVKTDFPF